MLGSIFFCSNATAAALLRVFAASTSRRSFEATVSAAKAEVAIARTENAVSMRMALQILERAGTVAERLVLHAHLAEHRHEQVRHRRVVFVLQVPSALHLARRAADEEVGQRVVIVGVAVAHVA